MENTKEQENKFDIKKVIEVIKNMDKVSIIFFQIKFSISYPKAKLLFDHLVENGYLSSGGQVIKNAANPKYKTAKVLFLDVDGVLNCHSTKDRCIGCFGIEDKKVALLKKIIEATGAKIVLVSSWKDYWTEIKSFKPCEDELAKYLDEKLAKEGLVIVDKTIDGDPSKRGKGILRYIELQKEKGIDIDRYVILDDEPFDYSETKMMKHLITTSFDKNGLEEKHVRKAISLLN